MRLPLLEELMLRTSVPLVTYPGDESRELKRIKQWVTGKSRGAWQERGHPHLYHIGLWYQGGLGDGVVSHWERLGCDWVRTCSWTNPPPGYDFI